MVGIAELSLITKGKEFVGPVLGGRSKVSSKMRLLGRAI